MCVFNLVLVAWRNDIGAVDLAWVQTLWVGSFVLVILSLGLLLLLRHDEVEEDVPFPLLEPSHADRVPD